MKTISTFVIALLVLGFLFLALPEKGNAGFAVIPGGPPCCDSEIGNICNGGVDAENLCENFPACELEGTCVLLDNAICVQTGEQSGRCEPAGCCQFVEGGEGVECGNTTLSVCNDDGGEFFPAESCPFDGVVCSGFVPPIESRNVPALSEWGLIAMAGILGIIGFIMVMRRRKATA